MPFLYFNWINKLIQSSKNIKKDSLFKFFALKYIQKIKKNKIKVVISNLKFSITGLNISLNVIKKFSILTIDNKNIKTIPILSFLLIILADNIDVSSYSFFKEAENANSNNIINKNKVEEEIKLKDKK